MKLKTFRAKYAPYAFVPSEVGYLVLAFFTSFTFAPLFKVPFSNPYNIINQYNGANFNPDNNFYGLAIIIVGTLLLFHGLRQLSQTKYAWLIKVLIAIVFVANFFLIHILSTDHGYAPGLGKLDNFHSGEQLSPANAFMSGDDLYSRIFYLRGAGIDAVLPSIGFSIFGKSIGSFLFISDMFTILAIISFAILVAFLVRSPLKYALFLLFFMVADGTSIFEFRDVFVWVTIGLLLVVFKRKLNEIYKKLALVAIGIMSSLMLYISIDRGVLLFISGILFALGLLVFNASEANEYQFAPKLWRRSLPAAGFVTLGLALGMGIPAFIIGWTSFVAFLKLTFIEIPSYGGLLVSQPFPPLFSSAYIIWGSVFLAIAAGLLLIRLYKDPTKDLNVLLPYTYIFVFGVLCIKMGSNRIDIIKMASVTAPLFLVVLLILSHALRVFVAKKALRPTLLLPISATIITLLVFSHLDFSRVLQRPDYSRHQIKAYLQLPSTSDDIWLMPETIQVRNYITQHTNKNDYIFDFTSDPAYYYLTNRKNPTRFYITWYTDPQPFTNEALQDLKRHPPKMIVYSESNWMDAPDNISMQARIPEINTWIRANYPHESQVGDTILLSR